MTCIYLDHNATTPLDPKVLDAMLPYLKESFGNASSKTHPYGWRAQEAVERARKQVATLLGASSREIVFTSGATESNNLALLGALARSAPKSHVISQETEHPAVLDTLEEARRRGYEVTLLRPDGDGRVSAADVRDALRETTVLVTIMAANNEIGTLQPLAEIGAVCQEAGVSFHSDAAQGVGKVPVDVRSMHLALLSLSAHKLYGPKGVGALFVRARPPVRLAAQVHGGGQEKGLRPGTLNVPGIVGLGAACAEAAARLGEEEARLSKLRARLEKLLTTTLSGVHLNGHPTERLPGTVSASFEGVDGTALLMALPDLAVSSGAACSTGNNEPSKVLKSIGLSDRMALSTLRFGLGRFTTAADVERAGQRVAQEVERLRRERSSVAVP